jgi:hypothetical protein
MRSGIKVDRLRQLFAIVVAFTLTLPGGLKAQEEVQGVLSGQLLFEGLPADTGTVVLHRVTPEEAGPVDSVSVGEEGAFSIPLPNLPVPGSGESFFATSRYDGILYFGFQVLEPAHLEEDYSIRMFRTEPAPSGGVRFPLWIREVWIEEAPIGWQVTDAFIIMNPASATYVPGEPGGFVWQFPLPEGARSPREVESGPSPGSITFSEGTIRASNPMAPGESFVMVQYDLDSLSFDIPMPGEVEVARVILREPAPEVRVEGLARLPPEEMEFGVTYRQWAGQELADQVIRIRPGSEESVNLVAWGSVILALLLVTSGIWLVRRTPVPQPAGAGGQAGGSQSGGGSKSTGQGVSDARRRREILLEIARIDEEFGALSDPSQAEQERHRKLRRALMDELEQL